ncbi:hypothetical protein HDU89_000244 [Geranomyces variabilis]|nr:hypothetical protein HDU89_000244 [Geranomyces variabilis]
MVTLDYADENDTVKYKDLQVSFFVDEQGRTRVKAIVCYRLLKGKRYNNSAYKKCLLTDFVPGRAFRGLDAVVPLLAMCFGDGVFRDVANIDAMFMVPQEHICAAGNIELAIKAEWLEVPIMRKMVKKGRVWAPSDHEGLTYSASRCILKRVALAAGFTESVTFYSLRRGSIDVINAMTTTSAGDLENAAGHNPGSSTYWQAYMSKVSTVDRQAGFLGYENTRHSVDLVTGHKRHEDVPTRISIEGYHEVENDAEMVSARARCAEAVALAKASPEDADLQKEAKDATRDRHLTHARVTKRILDRERAEFLRNASAEAFAAGARAFELANHANEQTDVAGGGEDNADNPGEVDLNGMEEGGDGSASLPLGTWPDLPHTALSEAAALIHPFLVDAQVPDTKELLAVLFPADAGTVTLSTAEVVKRLLAGYRLEGSWPYLDERPTEGGYCPVPFCGELLSVSNAHAASHIHACIREQLATEYAEAVGKTTGLVCPWINDKGKRCPSSPTLFSFLRHIYRHTRAFSKGRVICRVSNTAPGSTAANDATPSRCGMVFTDRRSFSQHLEIVHGVVGRNGTPGNEVVRLRTCILWCTPCQEWSVGARAHEMHAHEHLDNELRRMRESRLSTCRVTAAEFGAYCPMCLTDET